MTGRVLLTKEKHDEMEVEVVAVDNEKRQYQVMIFTKRITYKRYDECKIYARDPWLKQNTDYGEQ